MTCVLPVPTNLCSLVSEYIFVPSDDGVAARIIAEGLRGNSAAQYIVGSALERGRPACSDALAWLRRSSEQGYRPAETKLLALVGATADELGNWNY